MFRERQKLRLGAASQVFDKELVKDDKTGMCAEHLVDACRALPDASNFELGTLVEAGIPLKKVNTQIIDSRPTDVTQFEPVDDSQVSEENSENSNKE